MAIKYTLVPRSSSLKDADAPWLVYAASQSTKTVDLRQIAQHLAAHNSPFSEGTIVGLLTDFQRCIVEQLKDGAIVDLDMLGSFYTTLRGRGAPSAEEFTPELVEHICIRYRPSRQMEAELQHTPLEETINRADMRRLKRRAKLELNAEIEASRTTRPQKG